MTTSYSTLINWSTILSLKNCMTPYQKKLTGTLLMLQWSHRKVGSGKLTMSVEKLKFDEIKSMLKNNMVSMCPSSYGCTSEVAKHLTRFPRAVKLPCASTKLDTNCQLYLTASSWEAKSDSKWTILSSKDGSLFLSTSNSWPTIFTCNKNHSLCFESLHL